jgi:RTX calcium-binding nonapeptide repeat (4 copies)
MSAELASDADAAPRYSRIERAGWRVGTTVRYIIAVAIIIGVAAAPIAHASSARVLLECDRYGQSCSSDVIFDAARGERNDVTIERSGSGYTLSDAGASMTPRDGCTAIDVHTVLCAERSDGSGSYLRVRLGDGSDRLDAHTIDAQIYVDGGPGDDVIATGRGADRLQSGLGRDVLDGGPRKNTLVFGRTARRLQIDLAKGRAAASKTRVSFKNIVNVDATQVTGATILGDAAANDLFGGARSRIDGRGGNDSLWGDRLSKLAGGRGDDVLRAGGGSSFLSGGPGNDKLDDDFGWPHPVRFRCGRGHDLASPGLAHDRVASDCEWIGVDKDPTVFRYLTGRPAPGEAFARLAWSCVEVGCGVRISIRLDSTRGPLLDSRLVVPPDDRTYYALRANPAISALLRARRALTVAVSGHECLKYRGKWDCVGGLAEGFTTVLRGGR